jgi:hypothetical protein
MKKIKRNKKEVFSKWKRLERQFLSVFYEAGRSGCYSREYKCFKRMLKKHFLKTKKLDVWFSQTSSWIDFIFRGYKGEIIYIFNSSLYYWETEEGDYIVE